MPYRFYYLDKSDKIVEVTEAEYTNQAEAVSVAELHLAVTPHESVEVWQLGKMIYRGNHAESHL